MQKPHKPARRGFAAMDPATQQRICRKGGEACARIPGHMAEIGRIGGASSASAKRTTRAARRAKG